MQTILLGDDDRCIRMEWERVLQFEGYRVEMASDRAAGLATANKVLPVLVIAADRCP